MYIIIIVHPNYCESTICMRQWNYACVIKEKIKSMYGTCASYLGIAQNMGDKSQKIITTCAILNNNVGWKSLL